MKRCDNQNDPKCSFQGKGQLLAVLLRQEGISQTKLASEMDITRASMSELLTKVEKKGLIERKIDEIDKRMTRVYLTDLGKETAIENAKYTHQLADFVFNDFSEKEKEELHPLLERIASSLHRYLNQDE